MFGHHMICSDDPGLAGLRPWAQNQRLRLAASKKSTDKQLQGFQDLVDKEKLFQEIGTSMDKARSDGKTQ